MLEKGSIPQISPCLQRQARKSYYLKLKAEMSSSLFILQTGTRFAANKPTDNKKNIKNIRN